MMTAHTPIVKKISDRNYVASCPDTNVNASGDTPEEAIRNWREVLAFKVKHYASFPESQMSIGARRDLAAMQKKIREAM